MRKSTCLNGCWQFSFSTEAISPEKISEINFSDAMPVPGCFDVMAPWYGKRGVGYFKRSVKIGGLVKLNFDGVGIEAEIYWDGKTIGACPYAYMPESFVFDAGNYENHELIVAVSNQHNNIFFPFYDFYAYGGIFGSVDIENLPDKYIEQLRIETLDYKTGQVEITVKSSCSFRKNQKLFIKFDDNDAQELLFFGKEQVFQLQVPNFKNWSIDTPHLHKVEISLLNDQIEEYFGIRQIQKDGINIKLNGKKIKLCGFNRHESHPQFGAAMPGSLISADLQMMKEQGVNFVRGSHYPQRKDFLNLCDRLGILVWEETLGWDVKPPTLFSRDFLRQQKDQAKKLVNAHFNHPCIIIWGFLNETESQLPRVRSIIKGIYNSFKREDNSRLITYASNKYEKDCCMDLVDIVAMNPYPGWGDVNWEKISDIDNVEPRMKRLSDSIPADKPLLISETGGGAIFGFRDPFKARWSEEYQAELLSEICRVILNDSRWCGLVFWQFCDAKSYINGYVMGRPRGFNNKGILDEYRRPKMAWAEVGKYFKLELQK